MDFTLNSEQAMLRDAARRFLAASAEATWRSYADLGWLSVAVPADAGGLGADMADVAVLAEEMGRALAIEPFADSAVLAVRLVDRIAAAGRRGALLEAMASGGTRLAPALYEPRRRYELTPAAVAAPVTGGYALSGAKVLVAAGDTADGFLVTAVLGGETGLFLVDRDAPRIEAMPYAAVDGVAFADLRFDAVHVPDADFLGVAPIDAVEDALDEARIVLCADMLGGIEQSMAMTGDYLKTRTQFGQPLAGFQALQHAVAELFIEADGIRSSLYRAIAAFEGPPHERRRAVSACWVKTFEAARQLTGMSVHLHGAIGFTTEYQVGHYLRRAMVSERRFGDVEHHLARYRAAA